MATWDELVYMQDMNSPACWSANIGDSKKLIDVRDNKPYWITKLGDSQCWMTQNLDYDLDTTKELSPFTSDVTEYWTPTGSTQKGGINFASDAKVVPSYDPGDRYCANNTTSRCDLTASVNDGHDAAGNYYSWLAATANTGSGISSGSAEGSICPKGWRLPANGAYGTLIGSATPAQITASPYYFVYGGDVNNSSLSNAGSGGYYWSSTADSATNAYLLYFNSSNVLPSASNGRYFGFSVRCVAR